MAQEYVGGGTKRPPMYKKTLPVAPRKPLPSSNPRPTTPPKKAAPAPKKKTVVKPKPLPKAVPASGKKPAPKPAPKIPQGKLHDIYKDTHKNVPKTTPKPTPKPAAKPVAKPASKPTSTYRPPAKSAPAKPPTKTVQAPTPPKVATPSAPAKPKVDRAQVDSQKKLDDLWKQAQGYKTQLDGLINGNWTYDPESDASYKSLQELAQKNAKTASTGAMESMNDRGILNSTVTSDRVGQIEQGAQDQVTAAIPGLKQQAYGERMDKAQQLYNMYNTVYGQATQERAYGEDKRRWDLGYQQQQKEFETAKSQWGAEFGLAQRQQGFNEAQARIENSFKDRGLELDHLQYQLNELASIQKEQGYYDDQSTQQAIASGLKYTNPEGAAQWLSDNATSLYQSGADISKVISALEKRHKGFQSAINGSGGGSLFP